MSLPVSGSLLRNDSLLLFIESSIEHNTSVYLYLTGSCSEVKASFHRAVNGLLCKTKGKFDDIVMLRLVDAYCKPLLLYGSDACIPFKKSIALCFLENILVLMKQLTACEIQI